MKKLNIEKVESGLISVNKVSIQEKIDIVRDAARLGVEISRMYSNAIGGNPGKSFDSMSQNERQVVFDKVFAVYDNRNILPSELHARAIKSMHDKPSDGEWHDQPEYIRMRDILFIDAVSAYFDYAFSGNRTGSFSPICQADESLNSKIGKIVALFNGYEGCLHALVEMISLSGIEVLYREKDSSAVVQNRVIQRCMKDTDAMNSIVELCDKYFESIKQENKYENV